MHSDIKKERDLYKSKHDILLQYINLRNIGCTDIAKSVWELYCNLDKPVKIKPYHEIIQLAEKQMDCDGEFVQIVNDNFWDLV